MTMLFSLNSTTMNNSSLHPMVSEPHGLDYVNGNMREAVLPVTILVAIENIIGLFGNLLILLVYSRRRSERSNFRCFVLFMAWIDLTSCVTCVPGEVFSQLNWYKYENYEWICKIKSFFNVFGAWGSASILLLLAFDRQRKICRPLAWQVQPSLALRLSSAAVLISVVVAAPITVLWGKQTYVYSVDDVSVNVSVCEKSSEFSEDTYYPFVYITCVYVPVAIMMVVITILNVLTAKKLFCNADALLTEACSSSTLDQNTHCSSTSLNTLSERVSSHDDTTGAHVQRETSITRGSLRDSNSYTEHIVMSRFSSEATDMADEQRRTSVTFISLDDVTMTPDVDDTLTSERIRGNELHGKKSAKCNRNESYRSKVSTRSDGSRASLAFSRTGTGKRATGSDVRLKRKTIIMLVLTTVFVITLSVYIILISVVAEKNILQTISNSEKAVYFLFLRLYFVNCVLNPVLYGFMDPRFRNGIKRLFCRKVLYN